MEPMDIDLARIGLQHRSSDMARTEHRAGGDDIRLVEELYARNGHGIMGERGDGATLVIPADQQHRQWRKQGVVGETRGRFFEEWPAGARETSNDAVFPRLGEECCRTARGVIAGYPLSFDDDRLAIFSQLEGRRGSSDASPDDDEVCSFHGPIFARQSGEKGLIPGAEQQFPLPPCKARLLCQPLKDPDASS